MSPPAWWHRRLYPPLVGEDVRAVRVLLHLPMGTRFDEDAGRKVLEFQRVRGLPATGVVDEATATALGGRPTEGVVPTWFGTPEAPAWDEGQVRRFQSAHRLPLTGVIDEATATLIGDH